MKSTLFLLGLLLAGVSQAQVYPQQLSLSQSVSSGTVSEQKAIQTIVAHAQINQGAQAFYTAGQSITLQSGFIAQTGSVFQETAKVVN